MFNKMYIILCLLFIINSCSDNSTTPNGNNDYWIVNQYYVEYDRYHQKWDLNSKILKRTVKYDRKTYFPEGDYQTMYGKNYWNHDVEYIFKKNFGNILEETRYNSNELTTAYKYQYDENGYLSKMLRFINSEIIDTVEYINENDKLIGRKYNDPSHYAEYVYWINNCLYKSSDYYHNILITYHEFKYDYNDYIIEKLAQHTDFFDNTTFDIYNYKYDSSGYLIERIIHPYKQPNSYKETFIYDSNNLLIEIDSDHDKIEYIYDKNNYLIEIINYNQYDIPVDKKIYENLQ